MQRSRSAESSPPESMGRRLVIALFDEARPDGSQNGGFRIVFGVISALQVRSMVYVEQDSAESIPSPTFQVSEWERQPSGIWNPEIGIWNSESNSLRLRLSGRARRASTFGPYSPCCSF